MRPLSETLPTLREGASTAAVPAVAGSMEGDFGPAAILKALRAQSAGAGAPVANGAPGETAARPGRAPGTFAALSPRREARVPRPFGSRLSAALEEFDGGAQKPAATRDDGHDKALAEAYAAGERAIAAAREEEAQKAAAALDAAREEWAEATAAALSAQLDQAFVDLHNRLSDAIAAALAPVLEEAMRQRAVERFSTSLERLLGRQGTATPITIAGPPALLAAFTAIRGDDTAGLKLVASEDSELVASVNDTTLRTTIKAWASALAAATGSRHG
ncbi:MAG: hypothetical protein AcusKO_20530 [Acuticoccus sp.]